MKRTFILGEEWLYYKVYSGARTADSILQDVVLPITHKLLNEKLIDHWFFIRYHDPEPHLRLRFKLKEIAHLSTSIAIFKEGILPFLEKDQVWGIQTDTYVRELERYGTNVMEVAELLFFHDSELMLHAISLIEDEELYFLYILKCVDSFLDQFGLKAAEKYNFYADNSIAFKKEFKVGKTTRTSLAKKYRGMADKLVLFLNNDLSGDYLKLQKLLNKRNKAIKNNVSEILKLRDESPMEVDLQNLLGSFIHMSINRAFRDRQRFFEMVSYDFLERQLKNKSNIRK
jgi:thiopeptide-type bacteriocin biosynthesis protein